MKRIYLSIFLLAILLIGLFIYFKNNSILLNPVVDTNSIISIPSPQISNFPEVSRISFNEREYAYEYFKVKNLEKLTLIPNFAEEKSTQKIKEEKLCVAGISGGFYDEENKPLGGFISEGKVRKVPIKSLLLDGFLWILGNQAAITIESPQRADISLQSGPLLILNGNLTNLSIKQDKFARRSVAFLTEKRELMFMIIFDPQNITSGPNLEDLPLILKTIDKKQGFSIQNAINLDGGNASAIYTGKLSLLETTGVGSFFCVKK
jgi:uncharacterized protein YigE (DUF2233 family)